MIEEQSLGQNCQIRGNRGKTLKFVEVAQIVNFVSRTMSAINLQP